MVSKVARATRTFLARRNKRIDWKIERLCTATRNSSETLPVLLGAYIVYTDVKYLCRLLSLRVMRGSYWIIAQSLRVAIVKTGHVALTKPFDEQQLNTFLRNKKNRRVDQLIRDYRIKSALHVPTRSADLRGTFMRHYFLVKVYGSCLAAVPNHTWAYIIIGDIPRISLIDRVHFTSKLRRATI